MTNVPTNDQVAALLIRFGRLLELSGESGFRVRAYQKAADAIRNHPEPIEQLVTERRLTALDGVGPAIGGAVAEIVATGGWTSLAELESQIPPTLIDVLAIPGLGAKSVSRLYFEHGIADLPSLEAALIGGKLRGLPGFGAKSEARILAGIEAVRRRSGRMLLGTALPLARRLVATMEAVLPEAKINLAGSVRRMEETVGDIDLVVATASLAQARTSIEGLTVFASIDDHSGDWTRARLVSGPMVDIYFTQPEQFGSTLVRATGSGEHLALLGPIADASNESVVYARAGLPLIPPELRQGIDEFGLASSGRLFSLVEQRSIYGEFHCHTTWSDGASSVEEMARAARMRGYRLLGISDHSRGLGVANGLDEIRIREQETDIRKAQADIGIAVLAGAEVEVNREGELDFSADVLASLDIVIASLHSGLRQQREALTDRLMRVLNDRHVDIIAHPSGRLIERREPGDFDWNQTFAVAAETGTALEINADPSRLDLNSVLARRALDAGCLLTINCDAHHPDGFANLEYGVAVARKAGATPDRVLNCWPVDQIKEWLAGRQ